MQHQPIRHQKVLDSNRPITWRGIARRSWGAAGGLLTFTGTVMLVILKQPKLIAALILAALMFGAYAGIPIAVQLFGLTVQFLVIAGMIMLVARGLFGRK